MSCCPASGGGSKDLRYHTVEYRPVSAISLALVSGLNGTRMVRSNGTLAGSLSPIGAMWNCQGPSSEYHLALSRCGQGCGNSALRTPDLLTIIPISTSTQYVCLRC